MAPTTHRLVELSAHGPVIVRAPESLIVTTAPGEPGLDDDAAATTKLLHPAVTRWLESLIVAPTVAGDELDIDERVAILFAALDAHAVATEWREHSPSLARELDGGWTLQA